MNLKRIVGLILVIAGRHSGCRECSRRRDAERRLGPSGAPILRAGWSFSLMDSRAGHHFHHSSEWPASDFFGAWIFPSPGGKKFIFAIAPGTQENSNARGFLQGGEGRGGCFISWRTRSTHRR